MTTTTVDIPRHAECQGSEIFRGTTDAALFDEGRARLQRMTATMRRLACIVVLLSSAAVTAAPVSVTDFTGHRVTLAQPARRIVALTPHLVENLFTAGLGERVVGAARGSNYPAAAQAIPRIGGYHSFSLEAIIARRPDLVVAWAEDGSPEITRRLRALGIPVYVDDPRKLSAVARTIRDLGVLGGTSRQADRAAARFERRISALKARYAARSPVSLFWEIGADPLRTLSSRGMIGAVIRLCGGRNVFANAAVMAPRVSMASVIARNPSAIVAAGAAKTDSNWRDYWQRWPAIAAVAGGHFLSVPPDLITRPTVRIARGARDLCRGLDVVRRDDAARDND